jgi:hypothetical protein
MIPVPFKFDEIGYWSELKLEIVEKYGSAYTTAFGEGVQRRSRPLEA